MLPTHLQSIHLHIFSDTPSHTLVTHPLPAFYQVLSVHLRAGLDATWSASGGSWEKLMTLLRDELGQQAEDTTR